MHLRATMVNGLLFICRLRRSLEQKPVVFRGEGDDGGGKNGKKRVFENNRCVMVVLPPSGGTRTVLVGGGDIRTTEEIRQKLDA